MRIGLAALAAIAALAATSLPADGAGGTGPVQVAKVGGESAKGLVVASRRAGVVTVYVSVHGMPTEAGEYAIVGSTKPCSVVDGADFLAWRTGIIIANTEGDWFRRKRAGRWATFPSARSMRILDQDDEQLACGRVMAR
jgi:hypothetical protein